MSEGIRTTISSAARWVGADWVGRDREFFGVSSDSRKVPEGCLFIALRGERFDGHDYVLEAARQGAAAALVERRLHVAIPQIIVPDARIALGQLASAWRVVVGTPLLAITGSNGKTTTKEMAAAVLSEAAGPVLATRGNLNNDIGVPLTLLRLTREHSFGVIEMGANHPGEIAYLTAITRPDVALLNNAAPAHLEGFGSLEGVACAKGEIFAGLRAGGVAVVNADLPFADMWREMARPHRVITFGMENMADVSATWREEGRGSALDVRHPRGEFDVRLALAGRHNVMNALAVCAATLAFGIEPGAVQRGLESMRPVHGRLEERSGFMGMRVIDDTYNANPASLRAGMEVLAARKGRRILALGDMGELGGDAAALHAEAGRTAKQLGLDGLWATGDLARHAVEGFGEGGRHFADQAALVEALRAEAGADVTVLVKGSRSRRMERVVEALVNEEHK